MEHLKGTSLVQAPALVTNIRSDCKSLPGTDTSSLGTIVSDVNLAPGSKYIYFGVTHMPIILRNYANIFVNNDHILWSRSKIS
jgi:hypothetical protein